MSIIIEGYEIGEKARTYFIADIAANHDGDIWRAKELINLAYYAGADAVKFQHFRAKDFVSDKGFKDLKNHTSHQSSWDKSIFDVYKDASIPLSWTIELKNYCVQRGITFFSSPYGLEMVEHLDDYVPAWKVGSGDLNYHNQLIAVAKTGKPVLLATGASKIEEVIDAVEILKTYTNKIVLMQCNTNYTAEDENYRHINLNVLKTYKTLFPGVILGLSDHTFGHETVLGAIALGACVVEKHFTDDNSRPGPDHKFSMNPDTWAKMIRAARKLEEALGSPIKSVCPNEKETVVLQRRSLWAKQNIAADTLLDPTMFEPKRPCPSSAVDINKNIAGIRIKKDILKGENLSGEYI